LRNPYILDRPLTDQDLYTGREAAFKQVASWLDAGRRLVLVCGRPGIGATSFLNQLGVQLPSNYQALVWPLPPVSASAEEPLHTLLQALAQALEVAAVDRVELGEGGAAALARALDQLAPEAGSQTRVVCLDALPAVTLEGDTRWSQALRALSEALAQRTGLALVLTVRGLPERLDAVLPRVPVLRLGALTEDESDRLLTVASRGTMAYDYEAVRLIHQLCGGEPYFVQLFGHILFEERATQGWVGLPEVRNAVDEAVGRGAARFEQTWNGCEVRERAVLCAFAEMMGRHGVASAQDISAHLGGLRVPMELPDIQAALDTLAHQGLVDELGGKVYRMSSELLRIWIGRSHTLLDTVRHSRRYRQLREEPRGGLRDRRVDWASLLIWLAAAALVVGIAWVWRARDRELVVVGSQTPTAEGSAGPVGPAPTRVLPTPESGVAPGNIAYMFRETEDDAWDVYRMRSDGSDPTPLTSGAHNNTLPVWSPDGRTIAFVSDRDGNREIYVMNADGSNQVNLTRNAADDWTPCWSPGGQEIAFASFRDGDWEIYIMNADGTNTRRLTNQASAEYSPAWSPDGRTLACVSNRDGNLEIYALPVDGGRALRLTHDGATDQSPAWSPDGKTLVWESYRDANMEIWAADADGSNARNLGRDSYADDHAASWSPWGGRIAYHSNRAGGWDIYTLNLETGERVNLTASDALEQSPNWGP